MFNLPAVWRSVTTDVVWMQWDMHLPFDDRRWAGFAFGQWHLDFAPEGVTAEMLEAWSKA